MDRTKRFIHFVLPSLLAFALSGIYAIVDGFFVGNSIGDLGLSAINVAYPVVSLLQALGTGLGMGGAVLYTVHHASGETQLAREDVKGTITLLLAASVIVCALLLFFLDPILRLLGAQGELLAMGRIYLQAVVSGGIFQVFGTGVVPLIRNNGGATFSMVSMIAGFVSNILLDYLLVWEAGWGVFGAALATVIAQSITTLLGLCFLFQKKLPLLGVPSGGLLRLLGAILRIGIAPFGITMSPVISSIWMNRFSLDYGGVQAVAVYACVAYAMTIVYLLLQGVGDGAQPLMSEEYGRGNPQGILAYQRMTYLTAGGLSLLSVIALYLLRGQVGLLFGASAAVVNAVGGSLPIFLLGVPFLGLARAVTAGFYATGKNLMSYLVVYAEPVLLLPLVLILPRFLHQDGVWWSMTLSQILTALLAIWLSKSSVPAR